jgi:hypothetical protein
VFSVPSDNEQKVEFRVARYGEHLAIAKVRICEVCGEYRGEVYSPKTGGVTRVYCLCEGSLCTRCKTRRIFRRGKEMMSKDGQIWHVPWFASLCKECGKDYDPYVKQREEDHKRVLAEAEAAGVSRVWIDALDDVLENSCFIGGPYSEE